MNSTPFVGQYGMVLTNGVLCYAKKILSKRYTGECKQECFSWVKPITKRFPLP